LELGNQEDIERAHSLRQRYRDLQLGLVDGVVMAVAERLKARAIATLDLKHFGAVRLRARPKLLPGDL
jgi:predicted nucleic acid-binding protein